MSASHLAAAHMNRRRHHLIRRQFMNQHADTRYIRYRIHSSHLVKMDLIHRHSMSMALRFRNQTINGQNILAHLIRQIQMPDHMFNLMQPGVMVMTVGVVMVCVAMVMLAMMIMMAILVTCMIMFVMIMMVV